ncbi:DUF5994 domain-containing protein [Mycobacterium senriense]|uniref:Uncharacterized protein n=1 Tax=Mycobacterium senriense TaxID=2775496 RepID=A0ABN6IKC4_9MYCO|nr:DUF5994 family protein [Mycobacterium senriense]BCZ22569.1 hypothetical protein MTY59_24240 [Mycobacterium senriense]
MTRVKVGNGVNLDGTRNFRMPRFRLKPKAHGSGHVDGAWWPRSDDLMMELPDLIEVLSGRLGAVGQVMYHPGEWATTPTELVTSERAVHLDGSRGQHPNTVEVLDAKGNKLVFLVVPAHIDPDQAHAIVMAAAASGNASSVDTLLMISVQDRESRTERDAARERWDSQCNAKPVEASRSILDPAAVCSGAFSIPRRSTAP